jgi:hypothetical protein
MMTCSSASACACSRSPLRSASAPPAGRWACTTRPPTAGSAGSTAGAWRRCGSGSGAGRGCRTSWGRTWSSASSPSRSPIPAWGRSGSPPSWPGRSGAGSGSRPTESGACSAGTGSTPAPAAWASWRATPLATSGARPNPSPSGTSRPPGLASWSGSTASTSVASRAPRGRSGSTRRSTSDPASSGPSCTPHRAIHVPSTAARWWSGSPQSSPARAGGWRLSSPTTAPSFAPLTSARASGAWL